MEGGISEREGGTELESDTRISGVGSLYQVEFQAPESDARFQDRVEDWDGIARGC